MTWPRRIRGHSTAIGSFTFMIISAPLPDLVGRREDRRADRGVVVVGKSAAEPRTGLDEDGVTRRDQRLRAGRHEGDRGSRSS